MTAGALSSTPIVVREFESRDVNECGRICYEAFAHLSDRHGFPHDFPSVDVATFVMQMLFDNPGFYGIVAERNGMILGSNWLDERNAVAGIGPTTIDPQMQNESAGRKLMEALVERCDKLGFPGVRLVQAAYHARSLSLYTKLGFASREELAVIDGTPADASFDRYTVRPATVNDVAACNEACIAVHGMKREGEMRDAIAAESAFVAERDGKIRAYTTGLGYFGHSVGESNEALCALLGAAPRPPSLGFLLPVRNYPLFRWCLDHGMRVVLTLTLMSRGLYQDPDGPYLPSILY